jgi:hypothetical protein
MCFNRLAYIDIHTSSVVVQTYGVFDHLVEDKTSKCCSMDTQRRSISTSLCQPSHAGSSDAISLGSTRSIHQPFSEHL